MKYFIMALLMSLMCNVYAQINICSSVINAKSKQTLPGAKIVCIEENTINYSDTIGKFCLNLLNEKSWIEISLNGFKPIKIQANQLSNQTIELEESNNFMDEIIVSANYFNRNKAGFIPQLNVDLKDLDKNGAAQITDLISQANGITLIQQGAFISRPVIRGLYGNRILSSNNGIRIESQQWDDEHGFGINEIGLQRVEIIKGPASIMFGAEAMGGVINTIDEYPEWNNGMKVKFRSQLHSNNMGIITGISILNARTNDFYTISVIGKMLPDYYSNAYEFRTPNTRMNEYGIKAIYGLRRSKGQSIIGFQFNQAWYGILDTKDIIRNPNGKLLTKDSLEQDMFPSEIEAPYHKVSDIRIMNQNKWLRKNSEWAALFSYQNQTRSEFEENGNRTPFLYTAMNLQTATWEIRNSFQYKFYRFNLGTQGLAQLNTNEAESKVNLIPNSFTWQNGVFLHGILIKNNWQIQGGIRVENKQIYCIETKKDSSQYFKPDQRNFIIPIGSFGLQYSHHKWIYFYNISSGFRTANTNELYANGMKLETQRFEIGNPSFKVETNLQNDLGVQFNSQKFSMELNAFYNSILNYIYLQSDNKKQLSIIGDSLPQYSFHQSDAQIYGLELNLHYRPNDDLPIQLDVQSNWMENKRVDNKHLPYFPANRNRIQLNYFASDYFMFNHMQYWLSFMYVGEANLVAENEIPTPAYSIINLGWNSKFNYRFLQNISIGISVNNALDVQYFDHLSRLRHYGIYNQGRNVVFSIRWELQVKKNKITN